MREVTLRSTLEPDEPLVRDVLLEGTVEVLGRMPGSSNATLLVEARLDDEVVTAIYKPERGERPLWDFPSGLWRRERAARLLDEHLGWSYVPPTEVRHDAPLGVGTLQYFVRSRYELTAFDLVDDAAYAGHLARLVTFDVVANNTDRKAGHCLAGVDGRLYAIDHGLCFHSEEKLRTVLWDFAGDALDQELRDRLTGFSQEALDPEFAELLSIEELEAMVARAHALARRGRLPHDPSGRRYPWPLV
ncbi:MAG: SCO1664 family protein [Microthrixaceae bacterium]